LIRKNKFFGYLIGIKVLLKQEKNIYNLINFETLTFMLDFTNTKTAFAGKTDKELRRAAFLFGFLFRPWVKSLAVFFLRIAMWMHLPIRWAVKPLIFRQFCGGETLSECTLAIQKLSISHIYSIPDYSAEGLKTPAGFSAAYDEILSAIRYSKDNQHIPFAVFKPSSLVPVYILEKVSSDIPLDEKENLLFVEFRTRLRNIAETCITNNLRLLIDAEEYASQKAVDDLVEEMMETYNKESAFIFNTLQMYRHDRLYYLKQLNEKAKNKNYYLGIKLVRGAYMEKERARAKALGYPSPIQPDKASTDAMYDEALTFLTEQINHTIIFCGTHNEKSVQHLISLMNEKGLSEDDKRVWFSQLYGMSDHISYNLSYAGYQVAKYLPYGPVKLVIPYLLRRANENSSVKNQAGREELLLKNEIKRRKNTL
jgi:proline dehydrogenase